MPMVNVRIASQPRQGLVEDIVHAVGDLTARVLRKDPGVTVIAVDLVPREQWFVGGTSVANLDVAGFYLEISVTDGTNSKDEKAEFVARVYAEMERILRCLHPSSYVLVSDTKGDGYGYGCRTQESRYVEKALSSMSAR